MARLKDRCWPARITSSGSKLSLSDLGNGSRCNEVNGNLMGIAPGRLGPFRS
jgi:hypothetical protein